MTFTNTQTTELSLDQLDDISAGWIGGAIKGAAKLGKFARASNGIRSGLQTGLKNVVRVASRSVPTPPTVVKAAMPFGSLIGLLFLRKAIHDTLSSQGHTGRSPIQG